MPDTLPSAEETLEATQNTETSEASSEQPHAAPALSDDTTVKMDIGGEEQNVSLKDLRSGFMRQQDYTQKTQATAEDRRSLEAAAQQLQQRETALTDLLADPQKLMQLVAARGGQQQQEAPLADTDVPTVGTLKKLLGESQNQVRQEQQAVQQQMQQQQVVQQMETTANDAFGEVFYNIPDLKAIPFVGDTLKKMALEDNPKTLEEMRSSIVSAGKKLSKQLNMKPTKAAKPQAVSQLQSGIEPPGGSVAPPPPDKTYGKGRSIDWGDIDKDAMAWVEQQIQGGKS